MNLSWQHLLAFLVAVGVLVTVHEFGHYWVARRLGFKVLRFSVGFGKPLWMHVAGRDRTEYVIGAIPLGGYVKLLDEREGPVDSREVHRAFTRRPHWQRILVLFAGAGFNFAFAILVLAGLFLLHGVTQVRAVVGEVRADSHAAQAGLAGGDEILALDGRVVAGRQDVILGLLEEMSGDGRARLTLRDGDGRERSVLLSVESSAERRRLTEPENLFTGLGFDFWVPPLPARIGQVEADGPAARAGLAAGDVVLAVNGEAVSDFEHLRRLIESRPGEELALRVGRGGQETTLRVAVAEARDGGRTVGRIGIGSAGSVQLPEEMYSHSRVGPLAALGLGAGEAWRMTALQAKMLWRMLRGQVSVKNLSGPLTIMEFAGDYARSGLAAFASFLALISLSLGFLNLLPVPILDGGQILYQCIEWIKGSPLSERAQAVGQQVGLLLLVLITGLALFNDILRQFG